MIKRSSKFLSAIALSSVLAGSSFAADVDVPRYIEGNVTWTADNVYFLDGYTFVRTPEGASEKSVLNIEAGTVIKARETVSGGEASALVVTRGAMINATGTSSAPIIFTSELDDLDGSLGIDDISLWGGVIILGSASTNSRADGTVVAAPVEDQIEGFAVETAEIPLITFGGTDDDDNSGVFRYVSIRHGGAVLGTANEINGLSMGGVGRGTTIEYVEVFANKDDGYEWFGGTVNARYLVAAFGNDDCFDFDQGWRGNGQFWFGIQTESASDKGDKGGEHDGATAPLDAIPLGSTMVANATYIGIGPGGAENVALNIRDNAGVNYYNSIFVDYAKMIDIEDDNKDRFDAGEVMLSNSVWWSHIPANNTAADFNNRPTGAVDPTVFWTDSNFANQIADPMLEGISRTNDGNLDPRPKAGSPALTGTVATLPDDGWFVQTSYAGAFAPGGPTWIQGWTKLSTEGYLKQAAAASPIGAVSNISNRGQVGTGESVQIGGFAIPGSAGKTRVMVRAVGPGLEDFSIVDFVSDVSVDLFVAGGAKIASNDNWDETPASKAAVEEAVRSSGAFPLAPGGLDAALVIELDPGVYTAIARGVGGETGIALVELYVLP
ncbi:MAG: hypothetical protein R3F07_06155 [Opitutaceae bacterium]